MTTPRDDDAPHRPAGTFGEALLALARPNLAWVSEQLDLFDTLLPQGTIHLDFDAPALRRSGIAVRAHLVGTYDAGGTWLWAWHNDSVAARPIADRSRALRELGAREGAPELTHGLLDLTGFPDPRLAADHLMLITMGLLDGRGAAIVRTGERGWAFLVADDPGVPRAEPRPGRLAKALTIGPAMLPGPHLKAVRGWFARHGVEPEYRPGQVLGTLPGGDRLTVEVTGGAVTGVRVTGADGGPAAGEAAPEQRLDPSLTRARAEQREFPDALLRLAARHLGASIRGTRAMVAYAGEHLGFDGRPPRWDADAGLLRFPGGGLVARELGSYDLAQSGFAWAPGTEDVRARFRDATGLPAGSPCPELDADRLNLAPYPARESVAVTLARTAADVAGGVFTSLGDRFWLVTDERLAGALAPPAPDEAAEEIRAAASWLIGITPERVRGETMRAAATAYFERTGFQVWAYGQPDFLSGVRGLYEVRVFFAPDGTVTAAEPGLLGQPSV